MSATYLRTGYFRPFLALTTLFALSCSERAAVSPESIDPNAAIASSSLAGEAVTSLPCTISWTNPVSGEWTDATKWSTGVIPGAADDVCITIAGNYTVAMQGSRSVNALTVGAGGPMLVLEAWRLNGTSPAINASLVVATDVLNAGTIRLTSTNFAPSGNSTLTVTNGAITNTSTGRIETLNGSGGARAISASIINDGVVNIFSPTSLTHSAAAYTNNGAWTVSSSASLNVAGTFVQSAGTLVLDGDYSQTGGGFHLNGGVITGQPALSGVALTIGAGSSARGTLRLLGASTLSGDVAASQTLLIEGTRLNGISSPVNATLTAASSFTNAGIIRLTSSGFSPSGNASFVVTSGTVSNASTGQIETLAGSGGSRTISASFTNDGSINVRSGTTFSQADAQYTNNNAFLISSVGAASLIGGTFVQAGSMVLDGAYDQNGGAFHLNGGSITGVPALTNVALTIGTASSGTGTLRLLRSSTLSGNVMAGQTLIVEGTRLNSFNPPINAQLSASADFTNAGTIRLVSSGFAPSGNATLNVTGGTLTNTSTGVIQTENGSGGTRTISGALTNNGTVALGVATTYLTGTLRTASPGTINGGNTLTLGLGSTFYGTGSLTTNIVNNGQFNAGSSPGLLSIIGAYTQTSSGHFNTEIGGVNAGTDFDRFTISGAATLAGTLNVNVVEGACAEPGSSYEFMTFGSRAGDFTVKNAVSPVAGQSFAVVPSATSYRVNVSGASCVPPDNTAPEIVPHVAGTLGNNGWYVSDVVVTWQVSDPESAITSSSGCGETQVTTDNAGVTFTCSATSNGGSSSQSVTIKRDATAPVVQVTRAPEPNELGWNNTDVIATFTATDAMSGIEGDATAIVVFSASGANQSATRSFADRAGNVGSATISGINIDRTAVGLACSATPSQLWPANNKLVGVAVSFAGADGASTVNSFVLRSVTSNEPLAAGDVQHFTIGTADAHGSLRASRRGGGSGRVYTLLYDVTDRFGNAGECAVTVVVPHDQRPIAESVGGKARRG